MGAKLEGKVAIVTGASAGMGTAHALALAREGADVAAVDIGRDQPLDAIPTVPREALDKVVQRITALGRRAIAIRCDVSKASEVENMVRTVIEKFGKIDILINNAGVITSAPFVDLTEKEWDFVIAVNLKGPFLCCKYVVPHMIAQKSGKIVNIGSVNGREPTPGLAHYNCSKAAVHMLTDSLSLELAEHNINVNCVAPGFISGTSMVQWSLKDYLPGGADSRQAYLDTCKRMFAFGREVTPDDVANAMLFLVSEESRNITGYTIYVDGGHKRAM